MPTGIPGSGKAATTASKAQIARFGHTAATLRQLLKDHKLTPRDFNKALGKGVGNTGIYIWTAAKGAPGPAAAEEISKKFNIPVSDLTPAGGFSRMGPGSARKTANGKMIWVEPKTVTGTALVPATPALRGRSPLSFIIEPDGINARLTLDVTMPVADCFSLLNIIKEAGALGARDA